MTTNYQGEGSRHTGDVNLASALMACGVPLSASMPVRLIERRDERPYATFHIEEQTEDGTETTEDLIDYWNGSAPMPADHGMRFISEFIKARPRGIQSSADLLDFAMGYLGKDSPPGLRNLGDIPAYVEALPKGQAAYVLAYIWNRDVCFKLYNSANRQIYYQEGDGREARRALIDTRLPRWQAKELISRLNG